MGVPDDDAAGVESESDEAGGRKLMQRPVGMGNPAGLATFGYSEKELIGKHADKLLVEIPHSVMSSEKPVVRFQDTQGIKKDGSWFPLSFSMSYAEWDNQAVLALIIRDLSERKNWKEKY